MNLSKNDQELINLAQKKLASIFVPDKHFVVAVLQAKSGKIYSAFNLKATATRASVCAESTALAQALNDGEKDFTTLVTVSYKDSNTQALNIVSPCGICREILHDYAPDLHVILPVNSHYEKVSISDLLAYPYKR